MKYTIVSTNDLEKIVKFYKDKLDKMTPQEKKKFYAVVEKKKEKDFKNYIKSLRHKRKCKQWDALLYIPKNGKDIYNDIFYCRAFGKVKDKWLCGCFTLDTLKDDVQNRFISEEDMLIPDEISLERINEKISKAFIDTYKDKIEQFVSDLNRKYS